MTTMSSSSIPIQEMISDCLSEARHPISPESQLNALHTLSSLTKVSSHNRTLLLSQFPESIPTIISLLSDSSPSSQIHTLALSILFNLSLNPNLKHPLASRPDLLRHLNNSILPSSPGPTHGANKLAASLICSLAMLDKNKAAFGIAGTVEAVVRSIETSVDMSNSVVLHLLSSLMELVQFHGNATLAVRAGAVPVLVRVLRGPAEDLGGSCFATLALMARFEEGIEAIRAVEGVLELLVGGLRRGCMASKEGVAEILIRMFEGGKEEECVREVAGKSEFSTLLADLAIRGSVKAREKAGVLMKVIMEADLDCYLEGNPWF